MNTQNEIAVLHALHTLNGLNSLSVEFLRGVIPGGTPLIRAHALVLLDQFAATGNVEEMQAQSEELLALADSVTDLYVALSLEKWTSRSPESFIPILLKISARYPDHVIYQEA